MACGVPVVASATGGLPEVVVDGETGLLAPVGDVAGMTERATQILGDTAMHDRFRRSAAARGLEFSAERIVPRYERLYETLQ
jgi:glycosyltransferase involved in cell wall biosynthesis